MDKLELLKKTLHPEKQMNIIDQCNIIGEALAEGGTYYGNGEGLAIYLEISQSKVYQMHAVYRNMIPELKEWFRSTEYQCRTAYDKAVLTPESQREFLEGMNILIDGGFRPPRSNTSTPTIKTNSQILTEQDAEEEANRILSLHRTKKEGEE